MFNKVKRFLIPMAVAMSVVAPAVPAAAADGDGIDFNNNNSLVMFHTKDCKAEGRFNYLDTGGSFSADTKKTGGPAWCRVDLRVVYRADDGSIHDTGLIFDANDAIYWGHGVRCYVEFSLLRPADGLYTVRINRDGGGC